MLTPHDPRSEQHHVSPAQSPMRHSSDQAVLEELADAVISMRLDLDEMRATTDAINAANQQWVGEVADQFAILLMSLAPLKLPSPTSHGSRAVSRGQAASRAGASPRPHMSSSSAADGDNGTTLRALTILHGESGDIGAFLAKVSPNGVPTDAPDSPIDAVGHRMRVTNASPSQAIAIGSTTPRARSQQQSREADEPHAATGTGRSAAPPLNVQSMPSRRLGAGNGQPLSEAAAAREMLLQRLEAAAEARAADADASLPLLLGPTQMGRSADPEAESRSAHATPRGAVARQFVTCTTFGASSFGRNVHEDANISSTNTARSTHLRSEAGASRQGRRAPRGQWAYPTDPSKTEAGLHDARLLERLASRPVKRMDDRGASTSTALTPRPPAQPEFQHPVSAPHQPVAATAVGQNYRTPFKPNTEVLSLASKANFAAPTRGDARSSSPGATATTKLAAVAADATDRHAGTAVVVSMPTRPDLSRGSDRAFQPAQVRRMMARHQQEEPVAFSSQTPREVARYVHPASTKHVAAVPPLRVVTTRVNRHGDIPDGVDNNSSAIVGW